ncbi:unnamed protein product [Dovyalis caffra]|uniref:F-box domain-containing protein n=1 Tax=Dovyalis caffra TaxID=77055 RepID=A0AAV1SI48_9ROSI|nr:unnamed protein product [Dovyalis caffra]
MADDSEKPNTTRDQSVLATSCSNKRTRTGSENPSSSSSEPVNFSLNDLQVLLIEVLQRLSTTKSAFLCKSVCKNWYSLISSPYFVRRFITHHVNHQYEQCPSALFINYSTESNGCGLFTFSDEPMFKSSGFELKYLPERNGSVRVLAIFNDLILCSVKKRNLNLWYYICNPFTTDWVALPLLELDDEEFNTKTQQWYRSVLEGSEYTWSSNVVAYNGKFLWYNGEQIFAYDPFNPELSTFIDCTYIRSTKFQWHWTRYCIGVCRGFLRMMQSTAHHNIKALAIWELKDYTTWEWTLVDKVYLDGMILENSFLEKILDGNEYTLQPLGFHPNDGAIVYLQFRTFVISCNTQTRELKMVDDPPGEKDFYDQGGVFRIELPLWPTPVPKRIEVLPSS